MSEQPTSPSTDDSLIQENKLIAERRAKLKTLRGKQPVAFPNDFRRDSLAADLQKELEKKPKKNSNR